MDNGATISFQRYRKVDENRPERFSNAFTVDALFPNEDTVTALKRELYSLSSENYIKTVKDLRFPNRSEMREFGKVYDGEDVYIKIRVEIITEDGNGNTFVMSFHFAEKPFDETTFPYKKKAEV